MDLFVSVDGILVDAFAIWAWDFKTYEQFWCKEGILDIFG